MRIIKSLTHLSNNMVTKYQATTHLQCKFSPPSLELTLTSAFNACKSREHLHEQIRVWLVTSALTSAMNTLEKRP